MVFPEFKYYLVKLFQKKLLTERISVRFCIWDLFKFNSYDTKFFLVLLAVARKLLHFQTGIVHIVCVIPTFCQRNRFKELFKVFRLIESGDSYFHANFRVFGEAKLYCIANIKVSPLFIKYSDFYSFRSGPDFMKRLFL